MKRKLYALAKKLGAEILKYESIRDGGTQTFEIEAKLDCGEVVYEGNCYFIGDPEGKQRLLSYFESIWTQTRAEIRQKRDS